jgi:hypothetical protein
LLLILQAAVGVEDDATVFSGHAGCVWVEQKESVLALVWLSDGVTENRLRDGLLLRHVI